MNDSVAVTIVCSLLAVPLLASEAPSTEPATKTAANEAPAKKADTGEDTVRPTTDPAKERDELDRQLLRDLVPDLGLDVIPKFDEPQSPNEDGGSDIPLPDELDEAVGAMRKVSERLDDNDVSEDVTDLQDQIVLNIDALIERLRNTPPPSGSQNSPDQSDQSQDNSQSNPQDNQQQQNQPQPSKAQQQSRQPGGASGAQSAPQPQQGKAAESSEKNLREARERATALARRRALVDEVWGHLPEAMRERLLNVGTEKLLPKYERLIQQYYESLAEPGNEDRRR